MKHTRVWLAVLLLAVLGGTAGWFWCGGRIAPDVEFTTIQGKRIRLEQLRGHPVLVTFWASDCRVCLEEMPDLSELHRTYGARGFQIISVAMPYDPPNRVVALADGRQLPYPVALDPLGRITEAFDRVQVVPNSFLIDPHGRIVLHTLGRIRSAELRGAIESLLGGS